MSDQKMSNLESPYEEEDWIDQIIQDFILGEVSKVDMEYDTYYRVVNVIERIIMHLNHTIVSHPLLKLDDLSVLGIMERFIKTYQNMGWDINGYCSQSLFEYSLSRYRTKTVNPYVVYVLVNNGLKPKFRALCHIVYRLDWRDEKEGDKCGLIFKYLVQNGARLFSRSTPTQDQLHLTLELIKRSRLDLIECMHENTKLSPEKLGKCAVYALEQKKHTPDNLRSVHIEPAMYGFNERIVIYFIEQGAPIKMLFRTVVRKQKKIIFDLLLEKYAMLNSSSHDDIMEELELAVCDCFQGSSDARIYYLRKLSELRITIESPISCLRAIRESTLEKVDMEMLKIVRTIHGKCDKKDCRFCDGLEKIITNKIYWLKQENNKLADQLSNVIGSSTKERGIIDIIAGYINA